MVWTHNLDPVLVNIGPLSIHWYGVMYVLAFLFTWWWIRRRSSQGKLPVTHAQVDDLLLWGTFGLVIGARLGEIIFYRPGYYLENPLEMMMFWKGGLSFHGGLIGLAIGLFLFCKKHKLSFLLLADTITPPLAFAQAFGRIGNFINGELYGKVTDVAWAMIFPAGGMLPRHPSMLYEAFYNVVIGSFVFFLAGKDRKRGFLFGVWLILYAVARFAIEYVREPEVLIGPFTMGQLLCVPMLVLGIWLLSRKVNQ